MDSIVNSFFDPEFLRDIPIYANIQYSLDSNCRVKPMMTITYQNIDGQTLILPDSLPPPIEIMVQNKQDVNNTTVWNVQNNEFSSITAIRLIPNSNGSQTLSCLNNPKIYQTEWIDNTESGLVQFDFQYYINSQLKMNDVNFISCPQSKTVLITTLNDPSVSYYPKNVLYTDKTIANTCGFGLETTTP